MPRLEVEIDEKGDFVGQVPTEIDAILKRIEAEHHKVGYGKGVEQAAKDAKKQIDETVRLEMARRDALDPLEKERYARIESDNKALSDKLAENARESDRLLKSREESHARELIDRAERLKRRDEKIRELSKAQIRTDALRAGARDESLDELEIILFNYIGFDDEMQPFVKQADGTPQLAHGKPVAVSSFVQQYVENHPHHRKPAGTRAGGDPRRGASFSQSGGQPPNLAAAKERFEQERSPEAINELFEAGRKRAS